MRRRQFLREGAAWAITASAAGMAASGTPASAKNRETRTVAAPPAPLLPPPVKRTILVWSEGTAPKGVYPDDIRGAVAKSLKGLPGDYTILAATLDDPEQGISQSAVDGTDVLFWWGHERHGDVTDVTVDRIVRRVTEGGMGIVFLHSAHFSKPLKAILGATGAWKEYTNDGKPQDIYVVSPHHPIARGVRDFVIPHEERYEEPFEVPTPETVVFDAY